jgi:hypothetical protein
VWKRKKAPKTATEVYIEAHQHHKRMHLKMIEEVAYATAQTVVPMSAERLDQIKKIHAVMAMADPDADATKAMAELIQEVGRAMYPWPFQDIQGLGQQSGYSQLMGPGLQQMYGLGSGPWAHGQAQGKKKK